MNQFSNSQANTTLSNYDSRSFNPFGYFAESAGRNRVTPQHLSRAIAPIQFERWAADIFDWRNAMREMELAFFPFRTRTTRIYIDTIENVFVKALVARMQELVLQREPIIYKWQAIGTGGSKKKVISTDLTQQLNSNFWFQDYRKLVLDAIIWGFRLIELGELDTSNENIFPQLTFTRPENIRIDNWRGALLTSIPYYIDGIEVQNDQIIKLWNHYIPTKTNRGVSDCGYGMLYNISEYAIHLKHLLGWNLDFIENYGQPTRVGTTSKQGAARKKFEAFLANPSANQYILLDRGTGDEVKFESAAAGGTGTGWKNNGDCRAMLKKELSQMVLGHEDAFMTTPGKVGANVTSNKDGFNESAMEQAINQKQMAYSDFEIAKMNEICMPSFRNLAKHTGVGMLDFVPKGYVYGLTNDKEDQEVKRRFVSFWGSMMKANKDGYDGGVQLANMEDLSSMFPEFPNGFIKAEPAKEIDQAKINKTETPTITT